MIALVLALASPAALALAPQPVQIQVDATQVIASFEAICLDHLGDSAGQAAAATGEPWRFVWVGPPENDRANYIGKATLLQIGTGAHQSCGMSAKVLPSQGLAAVRTLVRSAFKLDEGTAHADKNAHYWLITSDKDGQRFTIRLMVSAASDGNRATLLLHKL